jgi:hypothetical protein
MESFVFLEVPGSGQLMGWYPRVDRRFGTEQWELPKNLTTLESLLNPLSGLVGRKVTARDHMRGLVWDDWKQDYNDIIRIFFTTGYKIEIMQEKDAPDRYTAVDKVEIKTLSIINILSSHFKILPRVTATWIPETRMRDPETGLWRGEVHLQIEL